MPAASANETKKKKRRAEQKPGLCPPPHACLDSMGEARLGRGGGWMQWTLLTLLGLPGRHPCLGTCPQIWHPCGVDSGATHCPDAKGRGTEGLEPGEWKEAPWMHPLPELAGLGQFHFFLYTLVFLPVQWKVYLLLWHTVKIKWQWKHYYFLSISSVPSTLMGALAYFITFNL